MNPEFDTVFDSRPLNHSALYHKLMTQFMAAQLPGSSRPMASRVTVKGGGENPDVFRIFIIPDEELGELKAGRSYYSRALPGLTREHFEDKEACQILLPHISQFFKDVKNGDLVLFEAEQYNRDLDAFLNSIG